MDLSTLLAARAEADPAAVPLADVAATERDLLSSAAVTPPTAPWIAAATRVIAAHQAAGRPERVWPLLRVLEPLLPSLADPGDSGRILASLASQALLEGAVEAFLDRTTAAAEALDRAGVPAAHVERAALGSALLALGAGEEAEGALREALAGAERAQLLLTQAAARHALARLALRRGALDEALTLASAAAAGFATRGALRREALARASRVEALAGMGQGAEAEAEARRALAPLGADAPERAVAAAALARGLLAQGRAGEAVAALPGGVVARAASVGWLDGGGAPVWVAAAEARAAAGDGGGAAAALGEARRLALAFASRLASAPLRRSYLERVPEHRRALGRG